MRMRLNAKCKISIRIFTVVKISLVLQKPHYL